MYFFLLQAHSGIRWIVVLLLLVVLIKSLVGWLSQSDYVRLDRQLWLGLVNAIGIQFVLGLILIIWLAILGGTNGRHWEHVVLTLVAVGLIMSGPRFYKRVEGALRHRNIFIIVAVVSVIVYFAVARIGGWV